MANAKNYAGSFAEGFINAYLQAKRYRTLDAYYKFRMAQAGYTPPSWDNPFGQGTWGAPKNYWDPVKKEWGSAPDQNAVTKGVFEAGAGTAHTIDDAAASGGGSRGGSGGDENARGINEANTKLVAQQLTSRGVDPSIAAGAVAGLMGESGGNLDPHSFNTKDPGGGSGGMGQWNRERLIGGGGMLAFAAQNGVAVDVNNPRDALKVPATVQAAYIGHELDTKYSGVLSKLRNAQSPQEALNIWVNDYENPLDKTGAIAQRTQYIAPVTRILSSGQQSTQPAATTNVSAPVGGMAHPYSSSEDAAKGGHFIINDPEGKNTYPSPNEKVAPAATPAATPGVIPGRAEAESFKPYQTASLGMVPPPTSEPKAAAPVTTATAPAPSPVGSTPAQPLPEVNKSPFTRPAPTTPDTPLPPRYGDYGYTRDANGDLVPKTAPTQAAPTKTAPPEHEHASPSHVETLAETGRYTPTTGNVRGPPTWVPDNPPVNPIQVNPRNQPQQAPQNQVQPVQGVSTPAIPMRTTAYQNPAQQDNMDDMMAMRELSNDNSAGQSMGFAGGGPVPGQIVHFGEGTSPLMSGLTQSTLGANNSGGNTSSPYTATAPSAAGSTTPANASVGSEMANSLGMGAYPKVGYMLGASLGANNIPVPIQTMSNPGTASDQQKAAGFADGGVIEPQDPATESPQDPPVQMPQSQQPVVTSDQSVNDVSSQVAQGTALMGQAAKQEGSMGPQVHEDRMQRALKDKPNAPATPGQGVVQQGGLATQMNNMRYQIQNWPSIFSFGAQGNPNVGTQTSSTGFASGGSVDDEASLPAPEQTDYQMAMAGGDNNQDQGVIPPQQVAMLGGMPHMSGSMPLPSPRMGLGTGSTPRVSTPKGKPGQGEVTGGMPENIPQPGDHPDHDLPQGEHADKIPTGTPQIADRNGNPSKGFTDALQGGLKAIMSIFGLGGQDGALQDPNQQQKHEEFQKPDGAITPSHEEIQKVYKSVDPHDQLNTAMRNIAGMEAVHKYYLLQGEPELANKMVASMVMYSRDVCSQYGDIALKALHGGDLDGAVKAVAEAYNWTPDAKTVDVSKAGDQRYLVEQKNLNNKVLWQQEVGPQEIMAAAIGAKSGVQFWRELEKTAAAYDPVSASNVKQRDDYATQQREARLAWTPPPIGGTEGGGDGTPRVIPASSAPTSGGVLPTPTQAATASPPATPPGAVPPSAAPTLGVTPAAASSPQPGPPVAQPATLQDTTPQRVAMEKSIMAKYMTGLENPPQQTGDKVADARNLAQYRATVAERQNMAAKEISANMAEMGADARQRAQLQSEQFQATKALQGQQYTADQHRLTQEHADTEARRREAWKERLDVIKTHAAAVKATNSPMADSELNSTWQVDEPKVTEQIQKMKVDPAVGSYLTGQIRQMYRFNRGMTPESVADFVRGYTTLLSDGNFEYNLGDKSDVKKINDEQGVPRTVVSAVTSHGGKMHITLPDDFAESLTQMRAERTPKPPLPGRDTSMHAPPSGPPPQGRMAPVHAAPGQMPWIFKPSAPGAGTNPRHSAPTQGVIPPKTIGDYLQNIPRPNIHPYSEQ